MRKLTLPDTADGRSVWSIMWVSTQSYPVGDKAQTFTLRRLRRAIKGAADVIAMKDPTGKEIEPRQESVRLKAGGADIFLEEAEMGLMNKALEAFRGKLVGDSVEPLAMLDDLLSSAPEITSEEVEKFLKSLSPAPKTETTSEETP